MAIWYLGASRSVSACSSLLLLVIIRPAKLWNLEASTEAGREINDINVLRSYT